jgi:hypothetical protein
VCQNGIARGGIRQPGGHRDLDNGHDLPGALADRCPCDASVQARILPASPLASTTTSKSSGSAIFLPLYVEVKRLLKPSRSPVADNIRSQ